MTAGTRLGPYEIISPLGAGGMGEVYRARDTRLNRDVAIKVLPEAFASDPDRLARFRREAQVLASLNHPNIGGIHGLEEAPSTSPGQAAVHALVLELIEGPTLAERIAQGPIPLDEAVPIARQMADALEAAHERGIIHRDLKPANVKVRDDGAAKVLDFGLAKALDPVSPSGVDVMNSPTLTAQGTQLGVILGTVAYMAPEQARGKPVDKRADIWAFGCVLYEMLSGRRAFPGENVTDTMAAVVRAEPDWSALPAGTPASVGKLLARCLDKDRRRRLADIADARFELEESSVDPKATGVIAAPGRRAWSERVGWAAAGLLLLVTAVLTSLQVLRPATTTAGAVLFSVAPPAGWTLSLATNAQGTATSPLAVSPDGRRVALLFRNTTGRDRHWVRDVDSLAMRELAGTDAASNPFWSPDGRWIAFFAEGKLKKVDLAGGPPVTICDTPDVRGGAWGPDGTILFNSSNAWPLQRVSANGGAPVAATRSLSFDRKWAFASLIDPAKSTRDIYRIDVARGVPTRFTHGDSDESAAISSPDGSRVIFNSRQNMAFDLHEVRVDGSGAERILVADSSSKVPTSWSMNDKFVLYHTVGAKTNVWVVPLGDPQSKHRLLDTPFSDAWGQFSPDGRWVAYVSNDSGANEVYVTPFPGPGGKTRVSSAGGIWPRWRPDGTEIFYSAEGKLKVAQVDGTGSTFVVRTETDLFPIVSAGLRYFYDVSADGGRFLMNLPPAREAPVSPTTVVVNWTSLLRK